MPEPDALPGYVERAHDRVLAGAVQDAAAGRSRILVLVGESSTGKTRACWEAVQPLADQGWQLWHPFDPTRAEAALGDLHRVGPRTVVWLNEAQHYLGDRQAGARIAAALHTLLTTPERGPVLVLGTLWTEYATRYAALPSPGNDDGYSRVRELLGGRTVSVPETFDVPALASAAAKARDGDRLLADALSRAGADGRVAQDLAGAPELLKRYERARPAARALLEAAMDARRLGVGLHLPQAFLTDATADYLTDAEYDRLANVRDWAEQAYAELIEEVHGKQAPLRSTTPRPQRRPPTPSSPTDTPPLSAAGPMFRLADSLEQHGRTTRRSLCPPASFWHAAFTHLTHPDDLDALANAAHARHRRQWGHHLRHRAADLGHTGSLYWLARGREKAGDRAGAEGLYQQAADLGYAYALSRLAMMREKAGDRAGAENYAQQAADLGDTDALLQLAEIRDRAGDFLQRAADLGHTGALYRLAEMREKAGDRAGAENYAQQAADLGDTAPLSRLAEMREKAGDRPGAEDLYQRATDLGDTGALFQLSEMRDRAGAEDLLQRAADLGHTGALSVLAEMREKAGDRAGAESLVQRAADLGDTYALYRLAEMREKAGDRPGAEDLLQRAADLGQIDALSLLAEMRESAGDRAGAESLLQRAADLGYGGGLSVLAEMREEAGDRAGVEDFLQRSADLGYPGGLFQLAMMREEDGDRAGAEDLLKRAADCGAICWTVNYVSAMDTWWPNGLDPDGQPTPPWQ
ncbi:hypothetical protein AB0D56_26975 [Streptomyces sp. NPDC048209]|uniref:hypothetical protein n=1 Tax=Streptomyces sp. NPDC048209 TaxID=3156689 RepID=UPI00341E318D